MNTNIARSQRRKLPLSAMLTSSRAATGTDAYGLTPK